MTAVQLDLDRKALRRWHLEVASALQAVDGVEVAVRWSADERAATPPDVERLFAVERRLHGRPLGRSAVVDPSGFGPYPERGAEPDLVLDLTEGSASRAGTTWRVLFDGRPGEANAVSALLAGRVPVVEVVDDHGRVVAGGRPGSETPGVVVAAFEDLLARCTDLLLTAVRGTGAALGAPGPVEPVAAVTRRRVAEHLGRSLAGAAVHRIYRLMYRAPHWRVGWRFVDGDDVVDRLGLPPGWHTLADDGLHFYADPFPVVVDGRTHLFVEDFDHRLGRGVISVVPFDDDGPVGVPHPVLEHREHLSYPFVVEDGGEIWMIPETTGAGTVELYRAERFPDRWTCEAVLLDGVVASDATPFRHGGRWWLSATVKGGGSFSDALHLWSADRLTGPWRPHARNPVLVDIAAARPAGRVVHRGGRTLRPVQDGREGYGAALALAEITRLDDEVFEQRLLVVIRPGPRWPGRRLHTLNRAGRLECIDGSAWSSRLARRSRPGLLR